MLYDIITRKFIIIFGSINKEYKFFAEELRIPNFHFSNLHSRTNGVVRSIRTIKKGEELTDNYGYHYAMMPKEERQRKL